MAFEPGKWFISGLEFFGVLVPGAVALYILLFTGRAVGIMLGIDPEWPKTTLDTAIFLGISFIIGQLLHPPAHVLNVLYDWTYRVWHRRKGDPLLERVRKLAGADVGPTGSYYAWAKSEVAAVDAKQAAKIDLYEGISKMFRTLAFLALLATIVVPAARIGGIVIPTVEVSVWSAGWFVFAVLSFLVFCERRFASTQEAYQSCINPVARSKTS